MTCCVKRLWYIVHRWNTLIRIFFSVNFPRSHAIIIKETSANEKGGALMAYSELIKKFDKIRAYMRDFYV